MTQPATSGAQPGVSVDPHRAYNFMLLVNGVNGGNFTEVSGLGVKIEKLAYREAGSQSIVRAIPGRVTYSSVTLRFGLTNSTELWDWLMAAVNGAVSRRNVSIVMLDVATGAEAVRWNLGNAWPEEWYGAPLDANCRDLAIETLVLAHDGLTRVTSGAGAAA